MDLNGGSVRKGDRKSKEEGDPHQPYASDCIFSGSVLVRALGGAHQGVEV